MFLDFQPHWINHCFVIIDKLALVIRVDRQLDLRNSEPPRISRAWGTE
jgi:hypothetical protein